MEPAYMAAFFVHKVHFSYCFNRFARVQHTNSGNSGFSINQLVIIDLNQSIYPKGIDIGMLIGVHEGLVVQIPGEGHRPASRQARYPPAEEIG